MNKKNTISTNSWRLFIIAALVIFLIVLIFFSGNRKQGAVQIKIEKAALNVELLPIQMDTLKKLIDSFFYKRSTYTLESTNGRLLLKADRFSSNNIEFYNNPELLTITNQSFQIKNLPGNNGLEASFQILRNEGTEYVLVPTDILFRLIKSKESSFKIQ